VQCQPEAETEARVSAARGNWKSAWNGWF